MSSFALHRSRERSWIGVWGEPNLVLLDMNSYISKGRVFIEGYHDSTAPDTELRHPVSFFALHRSGERSRIRLKVFCSYN